MEGLEKAKDVTTDDLLVRFTNVKCVMSEYCFGGIFDFGSDNDWLLCCGDSTATSDYIGDD